MDYEDRRNRYDHPCYSKLRYNPAFTGLIFFIGKLSLKTAYSSGITLFLRKLLPFHIVSLNATLREKEGLAIPK